MSKPSKSTSVKETLALEGGLETGLQRRELRRAGGEHRGHRRLHGGSWIGRRCRARRCWWRVHCDGHGGDAAGQASATHAGGRASCMLSSSTSSTATSTPVAPRELRDSTSDVLYAAWAPAARNADAVMPPKPVENWTVGAGDGFGGRVVRAPAPAAIVAGDNVVVGGDVVRTEAAAAHVAAAAAVQPPRSSAPPFMEKGYRGTPAPVAFPGLSPDSRPRSRPPRAPAHQHHTRHTRSRPALGVLEWVV